MKIVPHRQIGLKLAKRALNFLRDMHPKTLASNRTLRIKRDAVEEKLYKFVATSNCPTPFSGPILIDAMWDNPNFWLRLSIIRIALGTANEVEIGIIGKYSVKNVSRTLMNLGINQAVHWTDFAPQSNTYRNQAKSLIASLNTPSDILSWKLPYDFPATILYDGVLKRQRAATVDIAHPTLLDDVTEALKEIDTAFCLIDTIKPKIILLSHVINFNYGALAWAAVTRGIPSILLLGQFGVLRFSKISKPADFYTYLDCPTSADIDILLPAQGDQLAKIGKAYLAERFAGTMNDIGSQYAFKRRTIKITREEIAEAFGWSLEKPIVVVYASNWFDYPHSFDMNQFRDLLDWLQVTLDVARQTPEVNWLFKAHPCDEWYGGITLKDLMRQDQSDHIRQIPTDWNGEYIMNGVDALITVYSTAGVEFAASGKPVLVADQGWYHNSGFVKWSKSRAEYIQTLSSPKWLEDLDLNACTERANIFAGWYFGITDWQGAFLLEDDSKQNKLYDSIPDLLSDNSEAINREISTLRKWFNSDAQTYNTFKMKEFLGNHY